MRGGSLEIVVPSGHSTGLFYGIGLIADVGFAVLHAGASFFQVLIWVFSSCTCFNVKVGEGSWQCRALSTRQSGTPTGRIASIPPKREHNLPKTFLGTLGEKRRENSELSHSILPGVLGSSATPKIMSLPLHPARSTHGRAISNIQHGFG